MTCKKYKLYRKLFNFVKTTLNIHASSVMCDYEKGMRKAILAIWPACDLNGCLFHYCQAIVRKAKQLDGLKKKYRKDQNIFKIIKLFTKLPLLSQEEITRGYSAILRYQKRCKLETIFLEFNGYFVKQWLNSMKSQSALEYRTNNIVESFNSKLKRKIRRNPSCYTFLSIKLNI